MYERVGGLLDEEKHPVASEELTVGSDTHSACTIPATVPLTELTATESTAATTRATGLAPRYRADWSVHPVIERAIRWLFEGGRSVGITELLQAAASRPIVVLFALVTQLGDVWFLFLLGGALYVVGEQTPWWTLDRRRGLSVFALFLTSISLIGVLKGVFHLGRPPGATTPPQLTTVPSALHGVFTSITTASGPGFPSGHALGTTLVWGGIALFVDRGRVRTRAAIAGVVVTAVSVSRLVLGVHYLVDVVVGAALGLVVLAVVSRLSAAGTEPGRLFAVSVVVGLLGLVQTVDFDSVAVVGGSCGGWLVWRWVAEEVRPHPSNRRAVAVGFAALGVAGGLFGVVYALEPALPLTFVGAAATVGIVVAAPLVGERIA